MTASNTIPRTLRAVAICSKCGQDDTPAPPDTPDSSGMAFASGPGPVPVMLELCDDFFVVRPMRPEYTSTSVNRDKLKKMQENKERLARAGEEQDKARWDLDCRDGAASSSPDEGIRAPKRPRGRGGEQKGRSASHVSESSCGGDVGAIARQYPSPGQSSSSPRPTIEEGDGAYRGGEGNGQENVSNPDHSVPLTPLEVDLERRKRAAAWLEGDLLTRDPCLPPRKDMDDAIDTALMTGGPTVQSRLSESITRWLGGGTDGALVASCSYEEEAVQPCHAAIHAHYMAVRRAEGIAGLATALTCFKLADFGRSCEMLVPGAKKKDLGRRIDAVFHALHPRFRRGAAKDKEYRAERKHVRRYVTLGGRFSAMRERLGEAIFFLLHEDVKVSYIEHMRQLLFHSWVDMIDIFWARDVASEQLVQDVIQRLTAGDVHFSVQPAYLPTLLGFVYGS